MPDDDSVESALAMLRGLPAEPQEQPAPEPAPAQARRALAILEEERAWSVEDRRAFGFAASINWLAWHELVRDHVLTLDPVAVVDAWLDLAQDGRGFRTRWVVGWALTNLNSIAPVADRIGALLRNGSEAVRSLVGDALAVSHLPIDVCDVGRTGVVPELTPTLRELALDGAAAFAQRHIPDPRLTDDERQALEAAEADLIAAAARRWA